MNLPITVTVDVAKATAKLSGPLVLGNTYQVTFQGLTEGQEARHPTLVLLGRPQLTNELDEGGRSLAAPNIAAMSSAAGVLPLNTQEMADVFTMAGLPPQAVAERTSDTRKPQTVLPGEVLHGAVRPHAALSMHFYVTTQGVTESGVDTTADSNGATLAQGDCTVYWAPFEFDGNGTPMILRGPPGATGPMGPAGIVAWPGCLTFQIDADPASPLYGHLIAWAESRYQLYHNGNDGKEGRTLEPHFVVCETEDRPISGMQPGHIYQIYYPETHDPNQEEHRQYLDLGNVGVSALFAQTLKGTMEASQYNNTSARTLNETSGKTNSLWGILKNVCNNILGITTAFAIAAGTCLFAYVPTDTKAEEVDGIWRPRARPKSVTPDADWSLLQSDSLAAAWTFTNVIGSANATPNSGNDAPDGHLQIVDEGAFLSANVPPCNEGQGFSLSLGTRGGAAAGTDAAGRSATDYDPLAGAEKFTICAWVYREWTEEDANKTRTNTAARIFSDISAVDGTGHGVDFRFGGLGKLVIQVNGQYPPKYSDTELVPPFSQTWTHVAVAYDTTGDGGHYWFYVNGYQVQTVRTMNQGAVQANENAVYIGNGSSQNTHHDEGRFIGEIDDVYVFKNWVPDAPGENNLCPELAHIMDTHDGNFTTDYEGIGAEPLGDIDPDTPMYSAEQIENILGGVLPTRWLDHATLPGLEITEVLVLGNEGMSSWEEVRSGLLPATYVPRAWDPIAYRPRYEVGGTVNFTGILGLGGTYISSWDDLLPDVDGKITAATNTLAADISNTYATVSAVAAVSGQATTNAAAIAANSTRLSAIESDYVHSSDIADFATNGTVASLETRVEVLEMPKWCTLYWSTNYVCHSGTDSTHMYTYLLPTNFPTKNLRVYLDDTYADYIVITTPKNWDPGREVEISVIPVHQYGSTPTNRYTEVRCADGSGWSSFYYSRATYSDTRLLFYPDVDCWEGRVYTLQQFPYRFSKSGTRFADIPQNGPETVEEWLALHPEWDDTTTPSPSLQSLRPSLSSSAPLALDADPAALEDLAPDIQPAELGLADFDEPNETEETPETEETR